MHSLLKGFVIIWICILSLSVKAEEWPTTMTFSYISHPVIVNEIIPIIRETYAHLGVTVAFEEQPSARNLLLVSSGVSDGEVAYSDLLFKKYSNLVVVGPSFVSSQFVLLCQSKLPCNKDIIFDSNNTIVMTEATLGGMKIKYEDTFTATPYVINRLQRVPKLLHDNRFDYGFYVVTDREQGLKGFESLQKVHLFSTQTHHILNDKFAFMKDDVSRVLTQVIAEKNKQKSQ